MSGTDYTLTLNYGLFKPIDNHDNDQWGVHLNSNSDALDTLIKTNSDGLANKLSLSGGTLTGPLVLPGAPSSTNQAATKGYVDSQVSGGAAPRNAGRLQAQWVSGAVVANDTVWLAYDAPYAGTVNSLTYFTGNGSFSVAIQINGTNVTGLGAVAVSSATPATANATAANTFTAGQRITAVVTAATSSPTDALLSLAVTWS